MHRCSLVVLAYAKLVKQGNLLSDFEETSSKFSTKPFLIFEEAEFSFSEIATSINYTAGYLQKEHNVLPGDRVMICMQNCPQFIIAFYAILKCGAIVVPVNPMNKTDELAHYINDCGIEVGFFSDEVISRGRSLPIAVIANSEVEIIISKCISPDQVIIDPLETCVVLYTSGTTGKPKGCMLSHNAVKLSLLSVIDRLNASSKSTALAVAPFFHVLGLKGAILIPAAVGATVIILPRWNADLAFQCIQRYKITMCSFVPVQVQELLDGMYEKYDITSLTNIINGSAPLPFAYQQKLADAGITWTNGFGLTETFGSFLMGQSTSVGTVVDNATVLIIDPETLAVCRVGTLGEIVVDTTQIFSGYWNNTKATDESFATISGRRFFRTGDIGYVDEAGHFFIVDRIKRMINTSGYKVWPAEVEAVMSKHPAINDVCVVGAKDAQRGEIVKAFVVLNDQFSTTSQEIIDWTRANLSVYKSPRIISFVTKLPKTPTGKTMWHLLQDKY